MTNTTFLDIIMGNSWSFLFDELSMTNQDYWEEDGFSIVGNPGTASSDTITFTNSTDEGCIDFGAAQPVPITFGGEDTFNFNIDMPAKNPNRFKYSEERILKELTDYISATYNQHYSAGDDKVQTLDLIEACGDG